MYLFLARGLLCSSWNQFESTTLSVQLKENLEHTKTASTLLERAKLFSMMIDRRRSWSKNIPKSVSPSHSSMSLTIVCKARISTSSRLENGICSPVRRTFRRRVFFLKRVCYPIRLGCSSLSRFAKTAVRNNKADRENMQDRPFWAAVRNATAEQSRIEEYTFHRKTLLRV